MERYAWFVYMFNHSTGENALESKYFSSKEKALKWFDMFNYFSVDNLCCEWFLTRHRITKLNEFNDKYDFEYIAKYNTDYGKWEECKNEEN